MAKIIKLYYRYYSDNNRTVLLHEESAFTAVYDISDGLLAKLLTPGGKALYSGRSPVITELGSEFVSEIALSGFGNIYQLFNGSSENLNVFDYAGACGLIATSANTDTITYPQYVRCSASPDFLNFLDYAATTGGSSGYYVLAYYAWKVSYSNGGYFSVPIVLQNNSTLYFATITARYNSNGEYGVFIRDCQTNAELQNFATWIKPWVPEDPYGAGGNSESGGGGGTFDDDSDLIPDSSLPTVSFADTGFTRIYNPSLSQLNALANYLWTDQTFLQTVINHLKQLLENPMDAIISLSLVPCAVPQGAAENVKVMFIDTGVSMYPATSQFVDVDCGTLDVEEYYGSALDYNPYTKIHAYLPYIGQVTLDTDEVMGKNLQVKYRIDIVTGMCAAKILVNQNVLYQFSGHCAINMPINSADFSSYIGAAITAGKMVAGVVAGAAGAGGLAAGLIGGPAPSTSVGTTQTNTDERDSEGNLAGFTDTTTVRTNRVSGMTMGEMAGRAISNTVSSVMNSKMTVEHAGGFSGNSGYLAVRRPYLIIERPRMCNPEEYGKYNGRPSMIYLNLGELTGYTEVQNIQLTGFTATNPEMSEIAQLLKSGVIL